MPDEKREMASEGGLAKNGNTTTGGSIKVEKVERIKGKLRITEYKYSEVPKKIRKILSSKANWIEEGYSPDMSTIQAFEWDEKTNELRQVIGSAWKFIPFAVWRIRSQYFEALAEMKKKEREEQGILEETWEEFLSECNVDHWRWTSGEEGEIVEASPIDDSDFVFHEMDVISWGGEKFFITDGIGTGYVILTDDGNGEYMPLNGRIFPTYEEAKKYKDMMEVEK